MVDVLVACVTGCVGTASSALLPSHHSHSPKHAAPFCFLAALQYIEEANGQIEKFDRGAKLIGVLPCIPR